jgi:hypothetical protein
MEETFMKHRTMIFLLLAGGWLMAQENPEQSPTNKHEQITVQGCVNRSSGDYILTQLDPGNSYVLHAINHIKLGHYLGQEVKVTGTKSSTESDTSDSARSAPSITITVSSISTVSKECRP